MPPVDVHLGDDELSDEEDTSGAAPGDLESVILLDGAPEARVCIDLTSEQGDLQELTSEQGDPQEGKIS